MGDLNESDESTYRTCYNLSPWLLKCGCLCTGQRLSTKSTTVSRLLGSNNHQNHWLLDLRQGENCLKISRNSACTLRSSVSPFRPKKHSEFSQLCTTHEKNDSRKRHTLHNKLKTLLKKLLLISIITSQNKQNQSPTILRTSIQKASVKSSEAAHDRLGLMDFGRILVDRTNS